MFKLLEVGLLKCGELRDVHGLAADPETEPLRDSESPEERHIQVGVTRAAKLIEARSSENRTRYRRISRRIEIRLAHAFAAEDLARSESTRFAVCELPGQLQEEALEVTVNRVPE